MFLNKVLVSAYFVTKHIGLLYNHKKQCIVGLLHIFNEFSESNGNSAYRDNVFSIEQVLYHFEMMADSFTYSLAEYFVSCLDNLLDMYDPTK